MDSIQDIIYMLQEYKESMDKLYTTMDRMHNTFYDHSHQILDAYKENLCKKFVTPRVAIASCEAVAVDNVSKEAETHIIEPAVDELFKVHDDIIDPTIADVATDAPNDFLQVSHHSDEIDVVNEDITDLPITTSVELFVDSIDDKPIEVKAHFDKVQSEDSKVQLTEFNAHSYFDPFLVHCTPLDFIIADLYALPTLTYERTTPVMFPCLHFVVGTCGMVILTYDWPMLVFDPGGFEDESFSKGEGMM